MSLRRNDYRAAERFAHQQLEIDNLRESGYRQLMAALALSGRREQALAVYDACRRVLAEELGMAPTARTTDHYEQIRAGDLQLDRSPAQGVRGYELKESLGEGSTGTLYRAVQPTILREVAIKVIRRQYADNPEFIRRFEAEAQTVARLEHPHIVPLYDYWRDPDGAYLVMRYLRGGSLLSALNAGPWTAERAATMLEQVAGALAYAHHYSVVHRDIKPGNILLDSSGNAFVADFGIAKELGQGQPATPDGTITDTLDYVSPEQILGEKVTAQTDIYSLGAVLYETLTGEKPFGEATVPKLLYSQLHEPIPLVAASRPDIPTTVDAVLQKATAKQPGARFATALEMAAAFRSAVRGGERPQERAWPEERLAPLEVYNPYKGLHAFQEADAAHFFGREALVQQLVERLGQTEKGQENRFLAVVGPSGSGKSSVIRAGLIPALRDGALPGSDKWFITEMVPGSNPLEELELALWRVAVDPPPDLIGPMQRDTRGLLRTLRRILPGRQVAAEGETQLLLVIDQFEELFTLVEDESERVFFLDSLLAALAAPRSPLRLVITLRADFYDRPLQYQQWGQLLKDNTEVVLPLNSTELTWAVREPARTMGVRLEEGLEATIVADIIDQPGALPLLQYALTELFERRDDRLISHATYRQLGGVHGALGQRAEAVYAALDGEAQSVARQLFLRLVTLGEGSEDTRRRVLRAELEALGADSAPGHGAQAAVGEVLGRFGAARFLTFDHDPATRAPTVEVAHEALLREWPRLRGWLAASRDDVRQQRLLAQAGAEWQAAARDPGYLLRGARLDQFGGWAETAPLALTPTERAYLDASFTARRAREAAEETRRRQELETAQQLAETERHRAQEQAHAAQRLRRRALYLAGALVVAAILALFALGASRRATANAVAAQASAGQAATSEALAVANAVLAAERQQEAEAERQLAIAARATAEAEALVRASAEAEAVRERETAERQTAHADEQARLATSRELSLVAQNTLSFDPELSILLALQGMETAYTEAAENALHQAVQRSRLRMALPDVWAAFHPDGIHLATIDDGTELQVLDLATEQVRLTVTLPSSAGQITYSPDGETIATTHSDDGRVILWDAATGAEKSALGGHTGWVIIAFSPDGRRLASHGAEGAVFLRDLESGETLFTFPGIVHWTSHVAFSSDGTLLAVAEQADEQAGTSARLNLWDTRSGALRFSVTDAGATLAGAGTGVGLVAFSPDGAYMTIGASDNDVIVLDLPASLATGQPQPLVTLIGHTTAPSGAAFSPDGSSIVTVSQDGTAKVWDPTTGEEYFTLAGHTGVVHFPVFSPDGRRLLTMANDGVRIWDVFLPGSEEVMALAGPDTTGNLAMVLSPDGVYLALGGISGDIHLRNAASGELLAVLAGHTEGVYRLAFSPRGHELASAGHDGLVKVWDVAGSLDSGQGRELLSLTAHDEEAVIGGVFEGTMGVAYSPDSAFLASSGADGLMHLWNAESGELLETVEVQVESNSNGVWGVSFSADGQYLAAARENAAVTVWRVTDDGLEELYTLTGFPSRVASAVFSPDSTRLLTNGASAHMALWDAASGEPIRSFSGHVSTVTRASFSADGQTVATGGNDATVRLWDVASGVNLLTFSLETAMWDVAFSPDGAYLYASSRDGVLRVYALERETLVRLAHERLTRWFTPDECLQYLHQATCPEKPPSVR